MWEKQYFKAFDAWVVVFSKWYLQSILDGVFIKSTKEQLLAKHLQVARCKRFVTGECLPIRELCEKSKKVLQNFWGSNTSEIFFSLRIYRFQDFLEVIVSLPVPVRRVTFSKHLLQSFNGYSHLWEEVKCKCQLDDGCKKGWEGKLWVDPITSKGLATLPRKCVRSWDIATVGIKLPALFNTKYLAAIPLIRSSEEK